MYLEVHGNTAWKCTVNNLHIGTLKSIFIKNLFPNEPLIYKDAFEISYMNPVGATPGDAVSQWRASPGHSAPMLSQGTWSMLQGRYSVLL